MAYNGMPTTTIPDWNELWLTWMVECGMRQEKERGGGREREGGGERKFRRERAKLRY